MSESDIIKKFTEVITRVSELENNARTTLLNADRDRITDKVCRSLGILKSAYLLSSEELTQRIADVRLGSALGLLETVENCKLTEMTVAAQPATLSLTGEGLDDGIARDKARAKLVKAVLGE